LLRSEAILAHVDYSLKVPRCEKDSRISGVYFIYHISLLESSVIKDPGSQAPFMVRTKVIRDDIEELNEHPVKHSVILSVEGNFNHSLKSIQSAREVEFTIQIEGTGTPEELEHLALHLIATIKDRAQRFALK
jgi:hypothetical protein